MRPIAYGILVFLGSGAMVFVWAIAAIGEFTRGELGVNTLGYYAFMAIFVMSLPAAIVAEIVRWRRRKKEQVTPSL